MTTPRVSIVVPTHGRRDSVVRLLRALGAQTAEPDLFEVVIAIDGSEDATRETVGAYAAPFHIRHMWQPQRGRASACNAGARLASGDILVFLDDDMEPTPGFVEAHINSHKSGSSLGVVGAAPIVVSTDASPLVSYRATNFATKMKRLASRHDDLRFTDVYTGNFSIRRDAFIAVGGYDEEFRLYGHEDYELSLRLTRAGVRFVFDSAAMAHQHYTKDFRSLAANIEAEGDTAVLFALKHPEVLPALHVSRYARYSRRRRTHLALLLVLDRAYAGFRSHVLARVERSERCSVASEYPALFARYDLVFDLLYWLGVETALHARGAPRRIRFQDVGWWISAAAHGRERCT